MVVACAPTVKILYDVSVDRGLLVLIILLLCACSEEPVESASMSDSVPALEEPSPREQVEQAPPAPPPASPAQRGSVSPVAAPSPRADSSQDEGAQPVAAPSPRADSSPDEGAQEGSPSREEAQPGVDLLEPSAQEHLSSKTASRVGVELAEGTEQMKLVSLAVGIAVEERTAVGVADRFTVIPPRFHCHSVVDSRAPESTIIHTWRRGARIVSRVELQVGKSPAWRTWSRQRIRPEWADQWSCAASTLEGHLLGVATFEVVGDAGASKGP
jgi:hypothetical protein